MNGPSYTVKLDQPMKWDELKALLENLQKEYCETLVERYGIGPAALGHMLGIHEATCSKFLKSIGVKVKKAGSRKASVKFFAEFLAEGTTLAPVAPDSRLDRVSLTFSGAFSPAALAERLASLELAGSDVTVTVEIVVR